MLFTLKKKNSEFKETVYKFTAIENASIYCIKVSGMKLSLNYFSPDCAQEFIPMFSIILSLCKVCCCFFNKLCYNRANLLSLQIC